MEWLIMKSLTKMTLDVSEPVEWLAADLLLVHTFSLFLFVVLVALSDCVGESDKLFHLVSVLHLLVV